MAPRKQPGDDGGGIEQPRVFQSEEEAFAADPDPAETAYLESLDQGDDDEQD